MKNYFNYFIYISLIFLGWTLYKSNYLLVPTIISITDLIFSMFFLFVGFLITALIWHRFLNASGFNVKARDCLTATGLTIFGKYIPGKIWIILGVVGCISRKYRYSLSQMAIVGLKMQFCLIWVGLIFGIAGLILLEGFHLGSGLLILFFIGLTLAIFSRNINRLAVKIVQKLLCRTVEIPFLSVRSIVSLLPLVSLEWLLWSTGFYLLICGLNSSSIPYSAGLGFPLSASIGVLAIIAPGGLGIREGFLAGYLKLAHLSLEEATTIAVAARLWYFSGELFIFVVGLIMNKVISSQNSTAT